MINVPGLQFEFNEQDDGINAWPVWPPAPITMNIELTNAPEQNEALRLMFGGYGPDRPPKEGQDAPHD